MILHVDGNSFYASCERLFRPDLYGRPIAVLTNNDGIIIALNAECKALGFKRGDVYYMVRDRLTELGVEVFSSNYTLYADISARINVVYSRFASDVEVYSIDESFLYFPDWQNCDYSALGREIRDAVLREIGMPVSVGCAPTKTLAKMCNKLAKHQGGVFDWAKCDQVRTLADYPVGDVWGIGRAKTALLATRGVKTALDLQRYPLDLAKKHLTVVGFRTVQELSGIPAIDRSVRDGHKTILCSRAFGAAVFYFDEIAAALSQFVQEAVKRLREDRLTCRIVAVYVMTNPYSEGDQYSNSATVELRRSTSYLPDILTAALGLLQQVYRYGFKYRKVLVSLLGLEREGGGQGDLFDDTLETDKKLAVMKSLENITRRYGRGVLHLGTSNMAQDISGDGCEPWKMKREMLSPYYTTSLADLPKVY